MMEVLVTVEKRQPMNADLLRQRRNLMVTSLVLTAINLAGATLKKDVSVLGASIEFSNPERILWGAWMLWAYFLIRYWQYLNEEPDLGVYNGVERWIFDRFPICDEKEPAYSIDISWRYGIFWSMNFEDVESGESRWHRSKLGPQNALRKSVWTIRALTSVATKTPRFTDYVLPFFVAATPLILSIYSFCKDRFGEAM